MSVLTIGRWNSLRWTKCARCRCRVLDRCRWQTIRSYPSSTFRRVNIDQLQITLRMWWGQDLVDFLLLFSSCCEWEENRSETPAARGRQRSVRRIGRHHLHFRRWPIGRRLSIYSCSKRREFVRNCPRLVTKIFQFKSLFTLVKTRPTGDFVFKKWAN